MKNIFLILWYCFMLTNVIAQSDTFNITTFSPPIAWVEEIIEGSYISFTTTDNQKNSYCRICVYTSTDSKGDINIDFESEWDELVSKNYQLADTVQLSPTQKAGNWDIKMGVSMFNFNKQYNTVILITSTGFNKTTSILFLYNNRDYEFEIEDFISSINYIKPESISFNVSENNNPPLAIIGKWAKSAGTSYQNGGMSAYIKSIYDYKSDNTYTFTQRSWKQGAKFIYVVKEYGSLIISADQITISPKKSIIESWENNNGALGKLMSTDERPLEKVTYQYLFNYDDLMKEWNLVLLTEKETIRDGKFAGISPYPNGWFLTKKFSDYDLSARKIF